MDKIHNKIIYNIVWKELQSLKIGKSQVIEFKLGRKVFKVRRIK